MTKKTTKENPFLLTIERIVTLHPKMSETEKQALAEWERTNHRGWRYRYNRLAGMARSNSATVALNDTPIRAPS